MFKRIHFRSSFAMVLLLALVVPILAACGGTNETAPADSAIEAPAAVAPATNTNEAPAAEAPAAEVAPPAESSAAGDNGSAEPGVLRLAIAAEPDNLDPQKASFVSEIQWIMLNWQPLMSFDGDMQPIPGAAESAELSEDGKTYTFKLRADSKYSNGDPLTAGDFEYAWKRLADPRTAGEYQFIGCDIIAGYNEFAANVCQGLSVTETEALDLDALRDGLGVRAIDDQTLEIELANPAPYFLSIAALWVGAPVREEDAADDINLATAVTDNYIGNGPFMLTEHQPDVLANWEANPNYQGPLGPVKLNQITMRVIGESQIAFQAYQNGELDVLAVSPEDLGTVTNDAELNTEVLDSPGSCTFYLGFNNNKEPFDNAQVRQAFAQSVDREAWVRDVQQGLGTPAQSFIPPGFPGFEESDLYPFDAEAAKQSLTDAGFADGAGLPPVTLTFSSNARNKVRFEFLANQFKQNLGVDVTLDPVDPTAYTALVKDEATVPQMFYLGWCADFPDPQNWLTAVFKTGGSSAGRIGFSSEEFDNLVAQADTSTDEAERAQLYSQAQTLLITEAPVAFISNDANKLLIKPYVQGITADTLTPLDYIPGFFNMKNIEVAP